MYQVPGSKEYCVGFIQKHATSWHRTVPKHFLAKDPKLASDFGCGPGEMAIKERKKEKKAGNK